MRFWDICKIFADLFASCQVKFGPPGIFMPQIICGDAQPSVAYHPAMTDLSLNIKRARKAANLTQQQVATACGVTRQAVQAWERVKNPAVPRQAELEKFAKLAKVPAHALHAPSPIGGSHAIIGQTDAPESEQLKKIAEQALRLHPRDREALIRFLQVAGDLFGGSDATAGPTTRPER
jgi:transcriptional regulator with XRE-family HTH domain